MKIYIKHLYNTLNYGSMMMGENLIYYLEKELHNYNPEFYIDTKEDFHIERLREATKYHLIFKDQIFNYRLFTNKIKYVRYAEKLIREKILYQKAKQYYNVIFMLGGDDFSEIYFNIPNDNLAIKNIFRQLTTFNKMGLFYMIGQTIGPYTGIRKKWARECFKHITIYSRDDESAKYMEEELNKSVRKSRDLAFLDLGLQKEYNQNYRKILQKYGLQSNEYITFVGTGLINLYTKNEEDFIDTFVKIINMVQKKYPKKTLVWLSHVVTRNGVANDNVLLNKINKKYNSFADKKMVVIKDEILPVEARIILGNGLFTITCRMHAAVSTFQMNKPAICLSYSPKYKGVIGDGLNMHELVLEAKSEELWQGEIVNLVLDKIEYVGKNYQKLITNITQKVQESQKIVCQTIDEIATEIKGRLK
jgi:colanic acid/amylovoran biosynthesis protein